MDEIIFKRFINKESDSFLGYYHIVNNTLYYSNIKLAVIDVNNIIYIDTNLALREELEKLLKFLLKNNIKENKIRFIINSNISDMYYVVLSDYANYYESVFENINFNLFKCLSFFIKETNTKQEFKNALYQVEYDSIDKQKIRGYHRRIKIADILTSEEQEKVNI